MAITAPRTTKKEPESPWPSTPARYPPRSAFARRGTSAIPPTSPFEEKQPIELQGDIPSPIGEQKGCPLASRCPHCTERCRQECPHLKDQGDGH